MVKVLRALRELDGVRGAFLFDSNGHVIAHLSHVVYDTPLLEHVSLILIRALDSLKFRHNEWDLITVHFSEGKLLLKSVGEHVLTVIGDNTINLSFASAAIRVADSKIRKLIEEGGERLGSVPPP